MANAKELRDKILGARITKERIKIVTEGMGDVEIEIEEPGIAAMGEIYRKQTLEEVVLALLINHSYVPGTTEKVFNPMDINYLRQNLKMKFPWVQEIFQKAKEWAGEEDQVKKLLDTLKNTMKSITPTQYSNILEDVGQEK